MADHARDGPARPTPHRVGRLSFELDGPDEAALLRLRGEIVGGADSWIPAALDAAFSALDQPGRTLRIARLEVDLGALPKRGLDGAQLTRALRSALAERLRAAADGAAVAPQVQPEAHTLAAAFRHFLATGRLPWWSPIDTIAALELSLARLDVEAFRETARSGAAILAQLRGARRLVLQFTAEMAARIAAALPAARPGDFTAAAWPKPAEKEAVEALVARIRRVAAASLAGTGKSEDKDNADEDPEAKTAAKARSTPAAADEVEPSEEDVPDGDLDIAVADAGLVLLHPFLPALFETRGLAAAGAFLGESEQLRAIQLTAILAGGETTREEPQLVMAKLLCGWPLDAPVPRETVLDAVDLAEAAELLRAVVGHWSALGQASPAALRETFLTRPGRLRERPDAWELEVERRGADVLLARLPWTLNPVRLPWMPRPLQVIWG
jgi:hypothetical protein